MHVRQYLLPVLSFFLSLFLSLLPSLFFFLSLADVPSLLLPSLPLCTYRQTSLPPSTVTCDTTSLFDLRHLSPSQHAVRPCHSCDRARLSSVFVALAYRAFFLPPLPLNSTFSDRCARQQRNRRTHCPFDRFAYLPLRRSNGATVRLANARQVLNIGTDLNRNVIKKNITTQDILKKIKDPKSANSSFVSSQCFYDLRCDTVALNNLIFLI